MTCKNISIILFNLGGPDRPESVQPFLFNLFNDPSIIGISQPFRYLLAKFISRKRTPEAQEIYAQLGGGSPLLENTQAQKEALLKELKSAAPDISFHLHIAMRYWHPFFQELIVKLQKEKPDEILLLPLYPQFSSTTTGSSYGEALTYLKKYFPKISHKLLCCYPTQEGFIEANFHLVAPVLKKLSDARTPARILFSAHGLPEHIVKKGDPYADHLSLTVMALEKRIQKKFPASKFDIQLCYQSKVGPLPWLKPSTESALEMAAKENLGVVLCPISFVSEHSETLVELDQQYRDLSDRLGLPFYYRMPTVSCHPAFLKGLKDYILASLTQTDTVFPWGGKRLCMKGKKYCPCVTE